MIAICCAWTTKEWAVHQHVRICCLPHQLQTSLVQFALQVWALLLESTHPRLATDIVYVAGRQP